MSFGPASIGMQQQVINTEISVKQTELSWLNQEERDEQEDITQIIREFGEDSIQYKQAEVQVAANGEDRDLQKNQLEISIQELTALYDALEDKKEDAIQKTFKMW